MCHFFWRKYLTLKSCTCTNKGQGAGRTHFMGLDSAVNAQSLAHQLTQKSVQLELHLLPKMPSLRSVGGRPVEVRELGRAVSIRLTSMAEIVKDEWQRPCSACKKF